MRGTQKARVARSLRSTKRRQSMPNVLVETRGGWLGAKRTALLDAIHAATVEALRIPPDALVLRLVGRPLTRPARRVLSAGAPRCRQRRNRLRADPRSAMRRRSDRMRREACRGGKKRRAPRGTGGRGLRPPGPAPLPLDAPPVPRYALSDRA